MNVITSSDPTSFLISFFHIQINYIGSAQAGLWMDQKKHSSVLPNMVLFGNDATVFSSFWYKVEVAHSKP